MSAPNEPFEQLLSGYLDDALSDDQRRRVEDRLRTDPEAASELESLRSLRTTLRAMSERDVAPSLGPEFAERVVESAIARARAEGLSEDHPLVRLSEQTSAGTPASGVTPVAPRAIPRRVTMAVAALAASILVAFFSLRALDDGAGDRTLADADSIRDDVGQENRVPTVEADRTDDANPTDEADRTGESAGDAMRPASPSDTSPSLAASDRNGTRARSERSSSERATNDRADVASENRNVASESRDVDGEQPGSNMTPGDETSPSNAGPDRAPMIADAILGSNAIPGTDAIPGTGDDKASPGGTQAIVVLDVRRTESGVASLAVRRAIERAGIENAASEQADEETVGAVTDAVAPEDGFEGAILYLEAPAKQLDRFVTGLVDDETGIATIGWNVVFDVPVLRAVDSIREVDPTSVRHESGHWVAVRDAERLRAMTGPLGRQAFLPVTDGDRPPFGGLGTEPATGDSVGDDFVTSLLVLIR